MKFCSIKLQYKGHLLQSPYYCKEEDLPCPPTAMRQQHRQCKDMPAVWKWRGCSSQASAPGWTACLGSRSYSSSPAIADVTYVHALSSNSWSSEKHSGHALSNEETLELLRLSRNRTAQIASATISLMAFPAPYCEIQVSAGEMWPLCIWKTFEFPLQVLPVSEHQSQESLAFVSWPVKMTTPRTESVFRSMHPLSNIWLGLRGKVLPSSNKFPVKV